MTNPMIRIHDLQTDEVTDREMTDEELEQYNAEQATSLAETANGEAKVVAREAILNRLGLTADEAAILLG